MHIEDLKIEEYLEFVEGLLSRLGNFEKGNTHYFFLCHAFHKDPGTGYHTGQVNLKSDSFKGITPQDSSEIVKSLILEPFEIPDSGSGFGTDWEWECLKRVYIEGSRQNLNNTRRAIFLLCLRKEILDQIQQGNEVFDIEQIYKRLKA